MKLNLTEPGVYALGNTSCKWPYSRHIPTCCMTSCVSSEHLIMPELFEQYIQFLKRTSIVQDICKQSSHLCLFLVKTCLFFVERGPVSNHSIMGKSTLLHYICLITVLLIRQNDWSSSHPPNGCLAYRFHPCIILSVRQKQAREAVAVPSQAIIL